MHYVLSRCQEKLLLCEKKNLDVNKYKHCSLQQLLVEKQPEQLWSWVAPATNLSYKLLHSISSVVLTQINSLEFLWGWECGVRQQGRGVSQVLPEYPEIWGYWWHKNKSVQTLEKISAAIFWIWVGVATFCRKTENSLRPTEAVIPKFLVRLRCSKCTPVFEAMQFIQAGQDVPGFVCNQRAKDRNWKVLF